MTRSIATSRLAAGSLLAFSLLPAAAFGGQVVAIDIAEDSYALQPSFAGDPYPAPPHGPVIPVVSVNGETYHHVEANTAFDFHLWVKSACTPTSLDSKVKVKVGNHEETLVSGWGGSLFTSFIDGEDIEFATPYQQASMPGSPVSACNNWLAEHYPSPGTGSEAVKNGFAIRIDNAFQARIEVTCGAVIKDTESKTANVPAWIHCLGSPLAQPPPRPTPPTTPGSVAAPPGPPVVPTPGALAVPFAVTAVAATVQPNNVTVVAGQTQLTAGAEITTNGKGTVQHRWVHNGGPGPVGSLVFAAAGKRSVSLPFTVSCQQEPGLAASPGSGSGGIGGLAQAPPNVKNGFVRLEIVSPPGNVEASNDAAYSVTCQPPPPPPPPAPPGGLAAAPQPPPPPGGRVAAPQQLPDLRIRQVRVVRGQPEKVEAEVINGGQGAAAGTRLRLWVTPQGKAWYAVVPALAAGQSAWVTVVADMPVLTADHVYLRVDDPPKVDESDEMNNGHQMK